MVARHQQDSRRRGTSAQRRLALALVPGIVVGATGCLAGYPFWALLAGWEVLAAVYLVNLWLRLGRSNAEETARHAIAEDSTIAVSDTLLILASVASLGAVLNILVTHAAVSGWLQAARLFGIVAGLVLSWLIIQSVFALRYARLYFRSVDRAINFHQPSSPCYSDFAYMAFTIGMTFQVSDTDISSVAVRRTITIHSLLSYLFSTVILASAINLLVTLSR